MIHWFQQLLHPGQLRTPGGGYWFWSGIGSDLGEVSILAALVAAWRHINCHEPSCARIGRYHHHASGSRWCLKHLPDDLVRAHPKPHQLRKG
jgi:hypothetical protein